MNLYEKLFKVDEILYQFVITPDYDVVFCAKFGKLKDGTKVGGIDAWGDSYVSTNLLKKTRNPLKVFKHVIEELKAAVNTKNIPYFTFTAEESRRKRTYYKLTKRVEEETGYRFCDIESLKSGQFLFVKP